MKKIKATGKFPARWKERFSESFRYLMLHLTEADLRAPPGNRFEHLQGALSGWCSIRVNKQYRLIFRWENGIALDVYLDPHVY